ncbi:retrovirus-related pol polyprotein from transposon TNT 1-94 [Tanacetum coccineum]
MASEHDCLEPDLQRFNNPRSSDELMNTPSKEDLDNLFGPMFEDYFERKSSDTTINSAVQPTHDQEDLPYTSSIINKCDADNIVVRNKSRLVAKGYKQEEGIDFEESFALVVVLRLFKMFIAFVLISEYHYLSMDVKRLFSYGPLKEEVYCQPT